jgi:hypothetical protein
MGNTVILDSHFYEQRLHFRKLGWIRRGKVVHQAEVVARVVQLPLIIGQTRAGLYFPWCPMDGSGQPAVMIDTKFKVAMLRGLIDQTAAGELQVALAAITVTAKR